MWNSMIQEWRNYMPSSISSISSNSKNNHSFVYLWCHQVWRDPFVKQWDLEELDSRKKIHSGRHYGFGMMILLIISVFLVLCFVNQSRLDRNLSRSYHIVWHPKFSRLSKAQTQRVVREIDGLLWFSNFPEVHYSNTWMYHWWLWW